MNPKKLKLAPLNPKALHPEPLKPESLPEAKRRDVLTLHQVRDDGFVNRHPANVGALTIRIGFWCVIS